MNVPYRSERLAFTVDADTSAAASPFVATIQVAQICQDS